MKEGYIVWNVATGDVYGVFRNKETAVTHLRKVVRKYFGKCPNGGLEKILDFIYDRDEPVGLDAEFGIKYFKENIG